MNKFLKLVILLIVATLFIPIYTLEVRTSDGERLVYQQKARLKDTFEVRWTHSVTLQPVIETYKLEGIDSIPLVKMVFDDNGPNLPGHPEGGQVWTMEDGKFIITNFDRHFTRVPVTIGAVIANHSLIYNGKETFLAQVYRPGGFVHIGLVKKNLYEYFAKEVELWLIKIQKR